MKPGKGKIMYCAIPTRLRHLDQEAKKIARALGYAPLSPFDCLSYEDSEGNPDIGRKRTLQLDIGIMKACDEVGVFGISHGVMGELNVALDQPMKIQTFYGLDPEWDAYHEKLKDEYGDPLKRLRGPHHLFALIGSSAIGKTYWSNRLMRRYAGRLGRVKNTTTRVPRDEQDHESYNFLTREEFEEGIADHQFLEHDQYLGNYYGSSLDDIHQVLRSTSGIFAITPAGAAALYQYRYEINVTNILLKAENLSVLLKNFQRRGITDWGQRFELRTAAERFTLPNDVAHVTLNITGDNDRDEEQLVRIIEPLISPS